MGETPIEQLQLLPREVLAPYLELTLILCCKYDDEKLRRKEIRQQVRILSALGWKTIINDDYVDIIRKDMYN